MSEYPISRLKHAAHTANGGWDLEQIDVQAESRFEVELPDGFAYHSGYRDAEGRQHWLFTKKAQLSEGKCGRCA